MSVCQLSHFCSTLETYSVIDSLKSSVLQMQVKVSVQHLHTNLKTMLRFFSVWRDNAGASDRNDPKGSGYALK